MGISLKDRRNLRFRKDASLFKLTGIGLSQNVANGTLSNSRGIGTLLDYEGILRSALPNEIRIKDARRLENLVSTQDVTQSAWTKSKSGTAVTPIVSYGYQDKYGSFTASRCIFDLNGSNAANQISQVIINPDLSVLFGRTRYFIKSYDGTPYKVGCIDGTGNSSHAIDVDGNWREILVKLVSAGSTKIQFGLFGSNYSYQNSLTADILVCCSQVENAIGQECRAPSEYIVKSTSYGYGVNGVKYYDSKRHKYLGIAVGDSFGGDINRWPDYLSWKTTGLIDNYCESGQALSGNIKANLLANIANRNYDKVFIEGGINDCVLGFTLASMQSAIQEMVAACTGKEIHICNITPTSIINNAPVKVALRLAYNEWLPVYCAENGIHFHDISTALQNPEDITILNPKYNGDNLHPNALGYFRIAEVFSESVTVLQNYQLSTAPAVMHEPATTNLITGPRDFTNALWVKTTCTAAKNAVGIDRAINTASSLTATADNAMALQILTSASAARITSAYVRRKTGTGVVEMTQDNGGTWTEITLTSAYQRYTLSSIISANPVVGFRIATSGDAIEVDYFQHELGAYATSPIIGSRTIDSNKIPLSVSVNFKQDKGICLLKYKMNFANSAGAKSLFSTNTGATDFIYDNGNGAIALNDGTNTATADPTGWVVGDTLLIAAVWHTDTMSIHVKKNAGAWVDSADATYDGAFPVGANLLLCNGNTDSIDIYHAEIRSTNLVYPEAITFAKSQADLL